MKTTMTGMLIFILCLASGAMGADELKPVEPGEISFSVHKQIAADESVVQRAKKSGEVELTERIKTETQTCILNIELQNLEDYESRFQVEWYFIGRKISGVGKEFVLFDSGAEEITLKGGLSLNKTISSKPFKVKTVNEEHASSDAHDEHVLSDYMPNVSGIRYAGHVLMVKSAGEILEIETDSSELMADEWIERLRQTPPE